MCLWGNREYPDSFENKLVNPSFKWVLKDVLFLAKQKWKGRLFSSIDLFSKLFLTCGGNVNYYKSAHHPIPTRGNRENLGNFQNKLVISPFNSVSRYIPFLAKLKGRGRPFLEDARRESHCETTPKSTWLS